jgi:hypothetical protein
VDPETLVRFTRPNSEMGTAHHGSTEHTEAARKVRRDSGAIAIQEWKNHMLNFNIHTLPHHQAVNLPKVLTATS